MAAATAAVGITQAKPAEGATADAKTPLAADVYPWPLALLVFGLALGASLGINARTHNWLGVTAKSTEASSKSTEASSKSTEAASNQPGKSSPSAREGVLFAAPAAKECETFRRALAEKSLGRELRTAKEKNIRDFATAVHDEKTLEAALDNLICSSN